MPRPRWLVYATAVLPPEIAPHVLDTVEAALDDHDIHVFRGADVRGDRAHHRLTFAMISTGDTAREALYNALLDTRLTITSAGGKLDRIEDETVQRLGP